MAAGIVTRARVLLLATFLVVGLVVSVPVAVPDSSNSIGTTAQGMSDPSAARKVPASYTPSARTNSPKSTLRVSRKTKRSKPKLALKGLAGRVTVTARYRAQRGNARTVGRSSTKRRQVTAPSSWVLAVPRTTYRVSVRAPGVDPLTRSIPTKRFNRTFRFMVQPPNLATDFARFGTAATFWDTCIYSLIDGTDTVSSVSPSNTLYYGGNVNGKFASHVKFALQKVTEVTGFKFEYAPYSRNINYFEFAIKDNSKKASKYAWQLSGMAGPGWTDYDSGKSRYTGADISLNLMEQAPANAIRRLIMHEVGHAMGLSHAKYPAQVMYRQVNSSVPAWGKGDLTGLHQVANRGCHFAVGEDMSG